MSAAEQDSDIPAYRVPEKNGRPPHLRAGAARRKQQSSRQKGYIAEPPLPHQRAPSDQLLHDTCVHHQRRREQQNAQHIHLIDKSGHVQNM